MDWSSSRRQGDYTVWIDGDVTRVLVYGGEAHVSASGAGGHRAGRSSGPILTRRARFDVAGRQQLPLLLNSDFGQHDQNWEALDVPNSPLDVNGKRFWVPGPDDTPGRRRCASCASRSKGEHGETGLIQKLDGNVSGYRHLWLRAMVRVDYADLSGGGTLGSEYPMMLRMRYEGPVENTRARLAGRLLLLEPGQPAGSARASPSRGRRASGSSTRST